ncbi:MAG: hypothetical protein ABIH92_03355 [Nanoarchaeota archaeon]
MRLSKLQSDMEYVKEHIDDMILTEEDIEDTKQAETELKEGKTISLENLKKELDL